MKKIINLIAILMLLFTVTSCNKLSENDNKGDIDSKQNLEGLSETNLDDEQVNSEQLDDENYYPITITNYNYAGEETEITFEKVPERVLAVNQSSIETLLALGLEDHILAASGLDHEVKEELKDAFKKVYTPSKFSQDKNTVVMMSPDFILSWHSMFLEEKLGDVDYWHEKGINTYISVNSRVSQRKDLENEYTDILNIGKIFNALDKAEEVVNQIKLEVDSVLESVSSFTEKKRVLVVKYTDGDIYAYRENSLVGDMISKLGAETAQITETAQVTEDTKLPISITSDDDINIISEEDLIKINPDIIFTVYVDEENENMDEKSIKLITENDALKIIEAVKNNSVYSIQLGEIYASGVRTADGIKKLANGIYNELN